MRMQSVIRAIYPAQCVSCDAQTDAEFGLCGPCWRETRFIGGAICDLCGAPLPGEAGDDLLTCDDCLKTPRPWQKGRAALIYDGVGRKLVLRFKHADRTELALPAAQWIARVASDLVQPDTVLVPVPLHWVRLLRRRYNQSALLATALGRKLDRPVCVDALVRPRKTKTLEWHGREARFAALSDAIQPNEKRKHDIAGKSVLLVDDVMTSGATFSACTDAAFAAGAKNVSVVTMARVVKDT